MSVPQHVLGHVPSSVLTQVVGKALLIVDPDVRSLDWLRRTLNTCGASVISLSSVDNTIIYLASGSKLPNLLVAGPGMSHDEKLQLIAFIRNELEVLASELPAIAFSTLQEIECSHPSWLYMYQAHLTTPPNERELAEAACRLVNGANCTSSTAMTHVQFPAIDKQRGRKPRL